MFERYTESARRVIFFARYEAGELGCTTIDPGHLLLGLLRESGELIRSFTSVSDGNDEFRRELERTLGKGGRRPAAVNMPLAGACKRALDHAAEEADRLHSSHIGPEHLLLGILRGDDVVVRILGESGVTLDGVRRSRQVGRPFHGVERPPPTPGSRYGVADTMYVPDAPTAIRIAEAVLIPLVGVEAVDGQKPFEARLDSGHWWVRGSGQADRSQTLTAFIARDGKVLAAGRDVSPFGV